ncbi:TonB-dependent receptor [Chitinophaga sp. MM2321]|uniref:SusC/RagA family TonB-linked outer membrane protein n=1 Tax=Chitinophaga sp. MM2321 TaxID=3137178 RepID=UPI0032D59901
MPHRSSFSINGKALALFITLLFFLQFNSMAQDLASAKVPGELQYSGKKAEKQRPLQIVLNELESQYKVSFAFELSVVDKKLVSQSKVIPNDLENTLNALLSPLGLQYKKLDGVHYVIQPVENKTEKNSKTPDADRYSGSAVKQPVITADVTVKGKVTSAKDGTPLIGVSVLVKGTVKGTATDVEGNYTLTFPDANNTLVFSFIGYSAQEVEINGRSSINVALAEGIQNLERVVITGYSTQRKRDITGSVTVVDIDQLKATPSSNFGQQLQGKAAGVTIGTQGAPGASSTIRIRGIGTVNSNGPLYIIDGVSTRNQDLNSINPNDIESMQILKDASSASIYGAQASNGVIIITTKKGKLGRPRITYDAYYSVTSPAKFLDLLDTRDRVDLMWKGKLNAAQIRGTSNVPSHPQFGTGPTPTFPKYITPQASNGPFTAADWTEKNRITELSDGTDWYKESTQNAPTQSHQLTLSGASESAQYLLGLNYFDQKGIFLNSYYKRYSARINTQFNVRKWLRVGENVTLNFSNDNRFTDQSESNPLSWSYRMVPWVPVYDITGRFAGTKANGSGNGQNPVAILNRGKDNFNTNLRILGNIFAEADIISGLKFRTSFGLDHGRSNSYSMTKLDPEFSETTNRNQFTESANYNYRYVWSNTLNYEKTINSVHSIKGLVGAEFIKDGIGRNLSGSRYGYLFEDNVNTWTLSNGGSKDLSNLSAWNGEMALFGIFGRVDYEYNNRYLFTGIIRRDGSSRFSPSNRYGVFPSASVGWRISQENFMKEVDWVDDLKLRAGYGVTGNSEIPRVTNWADEYITNPPQTNYDFDGTQGSAFTGFALSRYGNSDTKWETTKMLNVGFDATLFHGKLEANIEYYVKKTSDMLVVDNYSSLAGTATPPYVNLGNMENKGWDIALNHKGNMGKVGYNVGFNISTYQNKVLRLNRAAGTRIFGGATRYGNVTVTQQGSPISQFYGYNIKGFYTSEEDVLAYKGTTGDRKGLPVLPISVAGDGNLVAKEWVGKYIFEDVNGDGRINADDKTIIGNPNPDFTGGVSLGLNYKNFDLSAFLYASVGNDIYNQVKWWTDFQSQDGNRSATMRDKSWEPGKKDAVLPILDEGDIFSNGDANSYFVEDGTFLRMQTLSLGYTLPKTVLTKIGIQNFRLYLQAVNLFTLTKYTGLDPEVMNNSMGDTGDITKGVDYGRWPQSRQFLLGLNVTF